MAITAAMVQQLRAQTGLPMMECKKALEEAGGDAEKAKDILRKQAGSRMGKFEGREAAQGRVTVHAGGGVVAMVELRCETEPVAGTEDFQRLSSEAARAAALMENPTPEAVRASKLSSDPSRTVGDMLNDVFNKIREKMEIKRAARLSGTVGSYVHFNAQAGAIISMSGPCSDEVMRDVCMHIVSMKPTATRREDVPAAAVEKERAVFVEEAKGKPEPVVAKIVSGKLDRWFGEFVLLEQPFVKDDKQTVGNYLKSVSPGLTVNAFVRFQVGAAS